MIRKSIPLAVLALLGACTASPTAPPAHLPTTHVLRDDAPTFGGGVGLTQPPPQPGGGGSGDNEGFLGSGN